MTKNVPPPPATPASSPQIEYTSPLFARVPGGGVIDESQVQARLAELEAEAAKDRAHLQAARARYKGTFPTSMQEKPAIVLHVEIGDADADGRVDVAFWFSIFGKQFAPIVNNLPAEEVMDRLRGVGGTLAMVLSQLGPIVGRAVAGFPGVLFR